MSHTYDKVSGNKAKLTFTIPAEQFDEALQQALRESSVGSGTAELKPPATEGNPDPDRKRPHPGKPFVRNPGRRRMP